MKRYPRRLAALLGVTQFVVDPLVALRTNYAVPLMYLGLPQQAPGRAERRVRGYVANDKSLGAHLESRASEQRRTAAQLAAANADFERARIDLERREALAKSASCRVAPVAWRMLKRYEEALVRAPIDKIGLALLELAGLVDRSGETPSTLANMGLSSDAVRSALDNMAQSHSVMLASNELLLFMAMAFAVAAAVIWLAPRPTRKVDMTQAGH